MSATDAELTTVPLSQVEEELARQLHVIKGPGEAPVLRAHMSNLIVYSEEGQVADTVSAAMPDIVAIHPARVLLLIGNDGPADAPVRASVRAWSDVSQGQMKIYSEQITFRAGRHAVNQLPFAVRSHLIGDLPTNLWWMTTVPPPLAGSLIAELSERVQQIIYDSNGWPDPAHDVVAVAAWLPKFERDRPWRVASDLNWRRLKYWRRTLAQALDPAIAPGALQTITELRVEHGPHAVIQACELASWLASRLGWRVQAGQAQPGIELDWQCLAGQNRVKVSVKRLPEGPSDVRSVRIVCTLDGKPSALRIVVEDERRLAVHPEAASAPARTITIQPQPLAELVGRQLSDRDRDPAFRESMAVMQAFAQSLLR